MGIVLTQMYLREKNIPFSQICFISIIKLRKKTYNAFLHDDK